MARLLRTQRPLWASFAIATLLNAVAALIVDKLFAQGFGPGFYLLTYTTVTVTSCLLLTTDLAAKQYALAPGIVYVAGALLGSFATFAVMMEGNQQAARAAFDFEVYTALGYSLACFLGIATVWTYAWQRRPLWAAALVAVPITVAIVLFIIFFAMGVGCAMLRDECP
jgi:hypothetical protein